MRRSRMHGSPSERTALRDNARFHDSALENLRSVKDQVITWEESLESFIRERPVKSLLIAAGAGMVMALLWRRR